MSSSGESGSEGGDAAVRAAESLFFDLVARQTDDGVPDVESLCTERPDVAKELREIRARYERVRTTLGSLNAGPRSGGEGKDGPSRFQIRRELARGGMGTILEVWDHELRRALAMKVLHEPGEGSSTLRTRIDYSRRQSRLLNEAQILAQLDHPGIVPVHEVGRTDDGRLFFTMQLVRGANLLEIFARLQTEGDGWTLPRAVAVVHRVCEAMAYAHARGVVHRDLKPQNVMVGRFGETYVMDWGLAKATGIAAEADIRLREVRIQSTAGDSAGVDAFGTSRSIHTDRRDEPDGESPLRTLEGDVVGTPAYMSPEQANGDIESVDERSDVFGIGAILYHMLTGAAPYSESRAASPREILEAVRTDPPRRIRRLAPDARPELVAICEKAMQRDRSLRYVSMKEVENELRSWLEGRVVRAYRSGILAQLFSWSGRHRLAVALLGALWVVVAASAITLAVLYRESEDRRAAAMRSQSDVLRRHGALFPQSAAGLGTPSFTEEFDSGRLDRRWMIDSRPENVEVRDGKLRITSATDGHLSVSLDPFVNVLEGDFDFTVDYSLQGFDVHPIPRSERAAGIFVSSLERGGNVVLQVARHAEFQSGVTSGIEQSCRASGPGLETEYIPDSSTTGRLRLSRRGDSVSASTWRNGWLELSSGDITSNQACVSFWCHDYYLDASFVFEVERFELLSYGQRLDHPVTSLREDFSAEVIAPELRIQADAGAVAVLDGQLQMEKLAGRMGSVALFLDQTRGFVLRGDFDLSVRFELLDFPVLEDSTAELELKIFTPNRAPFGILTVTTANGEPTYNARFNLGDESTPLIDSTGGLRFRRQGSNIEFLCWTDRWEQILVRPEVHGVSEMLFSVRLRSSGEERLIVALDELIASTPDAESMLAPTRR